LNILLNVKLFPECISLYKNNKKLNKGLTWPLLSRSTTDWVIAGYFVHCACARLRVSNCYSSLCTRYVRSVKLRRSYSLQMHDLNVKNLIRCMQIYHITFQQSINQPAPLFGNNTCVFPNEYQ